MEYNLADLFESVVDVVPGREALVYADHPGTGAERRLTYAELDAAANRVAATICSTAGYGPVSTSVSTSTTGWSTCRRCWAA
ncbi:hypothetical protein GCM10011428_52820 [Streptomyces violaceus]